MIIIIIYRKEIWLYIFWKKKKNVLLQNKLLLIDILKVTFLQAIFFI